MSNTQINLLSFGVVWLLVALLLVAVAIFEGKKHLTAGCGMASFFLLLSLPFFWGSGVFSRPKPPQPVPKKLSGLLRATPVTKKPASELPKEAEKPSSAVTLPSANHDVSE